MKNKILKKVDEAIEHIKPVVEKKMPCRKWRVHINLFWDDTFSVLFEYNEDLSEMNDNGKITRRYELSNQFWFSQNKPDLLEYTLIRFTDENREVIKKEEVPLSGIGNITSTDDSTNDTQEETQEENPPNVSP